MNHPAHPVDPPPRRVRFSLRTMLVVLVLVTLFASHLYTSYRLWRAEGEVRRLRDQLGQLVVTDLDRIHVLPLELQESKAWRWRIYLPEGRHYRIHQRTNQIPEQGVGGGSSSTFPPGEYEVTARVQKDEHGRWKFALYHDQGAMHVTIADDQAAWLERKEGGFSIGGVIGNARGRATKMFADDEPVVLLRVRASVKQPGGGWSSPQGPAQGVLVWIETEED